MYGVALMLTMATLGVDYGWQPGEDGQMEYIIQIEPELVETLREGKVDLLSEIPPELEGVKRFRIRVGKGPVPRKGLEEAIASGQKIGENIANQQPKLPLGKAGSNFPNKNGNNNSTGQERVLQPPLNGNNPGDAPLPDERDRFTGTGTNPSNSAFPAVRNTPGINQNGTGRSNQFPTTQQNGDQLQPLPSAPLNNGTNGQPGSNFNQGNQAPLNNGAFQQQVDPNDRWTNANPPGNRWASLDNPRGVGNDQGSNPPLNSNYDPRYANNNGLPEIRRDNNQNPAYPNTNYGPPPYQGPVRPNPNTYAWNQNSQPLRDPDQSHYAPDPNYGQPPMQRPPYDTANRQVNYNEVASTRTGTNGTNPPAASTTGTLPTTPAKATANDRFNDDPNNKPWLPLTFTAMLLFASVGLNFYLGWIANGLYMRYRALLMEMRNVRTTALA